MSSLADERSWPQTKAWIDGAAAPERSRWEELRRDADVAGDAPERSRQPLPRHSVLGIQTLPAPLPPTLARVRSSTNAIAIAIPPASSPSLPILAPAPPPACPPLRLLILLCFLPLLASSLPEVAGNSFSTSRCNCLSCGRIRAFSLVEGCEEGADCVNLHF